MPGPAIASALLVRIGLGVPLLATAVLKIGYDVLLYANFRGRHAPEERRAARPPSTPAGRLLAPLQEPDADTATARV